MLGKYRNRRVNAAIVGAAVVLVATGLGLVRSQATIGDVAWMCAMIPHHSIAILTSERANIEDPESASSLTRSSTCNGGKSRR